jgi:hypothetical protein
MASRTKRGGATARDARELARTPVPDLYRGQLADPYCDRPVPVDAPLRGGNAAPARPAAPVYFMRVPAPKPVTFAGVTGIVLGSVIALFGLILFAILSFQNELGAPDRSFYQGNDASYFLLALLDFGLAALCIGGGSALLTGRLTGRIALTAGGWIALGMSLYWWHSNHVQGVFPVMVGLTSAAMLAAMYDPRVTRWVGVLPPPQPD